MTEQKLFSHHLCSVWVVGYGSEGGEEMMEDAQFEYRDGSVLGNRHH
jgi:hypothetical protein